MRMIAQESACERKKNGDSATRERESGGAPRAAGRRAPPRARRAATRCEGMCSERRTPRGELSASPLLIDAWCGTRRQRWHAAGCCRCGCSACWPCPRPRPPIDTATPPSRRTSPCFTEMISFSVSASWDNRCAILARNGARFAVGATKRGTSCLVDEDGRGRLSLAVPPLARRPLGMRSRLETALRPRCLPALFELSLGGNAFRLTDRRIGLASACALCGPHCGGSSWGEFLRPALRPPLRSFASPRPFPIPARPRVPSFRTDLSAAATFPPRRLHLPSRDGLRLDPRVRESPALGLPNVVGRGPPRAAPHGSPTVGRAPRHRGARGTGGGVGARRGASRGGARGPRRRRRVSSGELCSAGNAAGVGSLWEALAARRRGRAAIRAPVGDRADWAPRLPTALTRGEVARTVGERVVGRAKACWRRGGEAACANRVVVGIVVKNWPIAELGGWGGWKRGGGEGGEGGAGCRVGAMTQGAFAPARDRTAPAGPRGAGPCHSIGANVASSPLHALRSRSWRTSVP